MTTPPAPSDTLYHQINHLFLPKQLPDRVEWNIESIENDILHRLSQVLEHILKPLGIERTLRAVKSWEDLQQKQNDLYKHIAKLTENESICFYVRKQNCAVQITHLDEDHVRFITFRASLPNYNVTKTCGSLLVTYPETLDVVPKSELLLSEVFSKQIEHLNDNICDIAMPKTEKAGSSFVETREPSNPCVISEFLVGILSPVNSSTFGDQVNFNKLKFDKKLRDQINWTQAIPFRRSGLWTSAKVFLTLNLNEEVPCKDEARLVYKIIVLEMLLRIAEEYSHVNQSEWNIASQIMVKLARRMKKMEELPVTKNLKLEVQREKTLQSVDLVIKVIHDRVSKEWNEEVSKSHGTDIKLMSRSNEEWESDCIHYMDDLAAYLSQDRLQGCCMETHDNLNMIDFIMKTSTVSLEELLERHNQLPLSRNEDVHLNPKLTWIFQVESFVREKLDKTQPCKEIYMLLEKYFKTVQPIYGVEWADPISYSRMVITILKLVFVLDNIAIEEHPLLEKYETGINEEFFRNLLIPEKCEMKLVQNLVAYFGERNSRASKPNWLETTGPTPDSFSSQYASQNEDMIEFKSKILEDMETAISKKKEEIDRSRKICQDLQQQISTMKCKCEYKLINQDAVKIECNRCDLESTLRRQRKSVSHFQRPLPPEDHLRNAVVFELIIPEELAVLRDSAILLLDDALGKIRVEEAKTYKTTIWTQFSDLYQYEKTRNQTICQLGSRKKATLNTHYHLSNPDAFSPYSEFIVENGLDCDYFRMQSSTVVPSEPYTFQILTASQTESDIYGSLQFSLAINPPTENEVLASQYSCHAKLSLREFKAFGMVRCANLTQLRNLYMELASKVLSLDKEPVVQLIMQTLWELGPIKGENHVDFEHEDNIPFVEAFLVTLRDICEENATNWSHPLVLLSISIVTLRILVMTSSQQVKENCASMLRRHRNILDKWLGKLDMILSKTEDKGELNGLMEAQLKCAITMLLTFNVKTVEDMEWIIRDPIDVTHYLVGLSCLDHLTVRENMLKNGGASDFLANLVRTACVSVPLNLHPFLESKLTDPKFNEGLHEYACRKWHKARHSLDIPTFHQSSIVSKQHAYQAKYQFESISYEVCIDLLRGTFFVDGFPPSVLPETIVRSPLFRTFFQTSQFQVQRDSRTFRTVNEYRGAHFEFTQIGTNLVIRQITDNGHFYELLPKTLFVDKIPHDLIDDFTQWYDSRSHTVYFRAQTLNETEDKRIEEETQLLLTPKLNCTSREWILVNFEGLLMPPMYNLLSIHSMGYQMVTNNLMRLEDPRFIHVQRSTKNCTVTAKLWRLELSFTLNFNDGLLYCDNFPRFYVPTSQSGGQNLRTLIGLKSGIAMASKTNAEESGEKKIFLIQHGQVNIEEGNPHQNVSVSVVQPSSPMYFVYEVDQVLNRLKAGNVKSSWLYLALLHASTSSPFRDPFTELTGTEMSMWFLQAGYSWSCSPYDSECLQILKKISNLSPKYEYYPDHLKNMQTITYPRGLENKSYAVYDGFAILIEKLIADSNRLHGLFTQSLQTKTVSNLELCVKSFNRNINMYNRAAHLSTEFEPTACRSFEKVFTPVREKLTQIATLGFYRHSKALAKTTETFADFIMTKDELAHYREGNLTNGSIKTWLTDPFRPNWFQLYSLARSQSTAESSSTYQLVTLIYGAFLYSGQGSLSQFLNLHNAELTTSFPPPLVSLRNLSFKPLENEYNSSVIERILEDASSFLSTYSEAKRCAKKLEKHWPTTTDLWYSDIKTAIYAEENLRFDRKVGDAINQKLVGWTNNRNLKLFVEELDKLSMETTKDADLVPNENRGDGKLCIRKVTDHSDDWVLGQIDEVDEEAKSIWLSGRVLLEKNLDLREQSKEYVRLSKAYLKRLNYLFGEENRTKACLLKSGIAQRISSSILLRDRLSTGECMYTGALAVIWANIKRLNRLILYNSDQRRYSVEIQREIDSQECENWKPNDNPEWLLLELDLDITIRPVQVQVARQMMNMPGGKNGVMQLNMGEGKTSVIIPMIVTSLTSSKPNQVLCRVTVLNSIFATNYNLLGVTIGGFLNKRLYTVPCNRDLDIRSYLNQIEETYRECLKLGGVMITLPEYRLSFRLQSYNNFVQEKKDVGLNLYNMESWIRRHARDLVDESDEIFSVKYQLIYTTGKQLKIDGGSLRWKICQKLLQLVPDVGRKLLEKYGSKAIEFQPEKASKNPHIFSHVRIIGDECKQEFVELMAEGILEGKVNLLGAILTERERKLVQEFLVDENINEDRHMEFMNTINISTEKREILLLISGYLRRGILFAALKKRWRVEYGVAKNRAGRCSKLTAVPFRAKDVAAERTEFGHPDMAIVLTQLSYFYSGLRDEQLLECFDMFKNTATAPESVYNSWIQEIPAELIKSDTIKTYQGINLQDYQQQKEFLFPILRRHTSVINFWLDSIVFPKACKQFPGKLVTNAFDLCYEKNTHASTGFSGTNDTSLLLPAQISQQDLACLSRTNAEMEETLMRPENMWKRSLNNEDGCKAVITHMIDDGLRVLIDAGALMLELGNDAIAQLWLDLDKKLDGVVYFNVHGEMAVKLRHNNSGKKKLNKDELLRVSAFNEQLDNCAVYLDDQHTRGTDIKLPTTFKACVTVGSGMRRDKLIQACMRMRKLGKGQSIHFYLSHEVHNKITSRKCTSDGSISVSDIIEWSKMNSADFEKEGLVYWATNAVNYSKNLAADDLFEESKKIESDWKNLAIQCQDVDAQSIQVMYGTHHKKTLVTNVIPDWFSGIVQKLSMPSATQLPDHIQDRINRMQGLVIEKCRMHVPDKMYFHSKLEEEQEKELEPEQEQEEEVQRPSKEIPLKHNLHGNVKKIIEGTGCIENCPGIKQLFSIFEETTIKSILQIDGSGERAFATEDFVNTVDPSMVRDSTDEFLKSIRFVVTFQSEKGKFALVLSQFEVNLLIYLFRQGKCPQGTRLHMFGGRWRAGQSMFINDHRLQLPLSHGAVQRIMSSDELAPLLVASGNLYFASKSEEQSFANYLGLALKPWTEMEEEAFASGAINSNGFVLPSCPLLRPGCMFENDPVKMITEILRMRNDILRDCDHVVKVLQTCSKTNDDNIDRRRKAEDTGDDPITKKSKCD